jgi:outer membrane protein
MQSHLSRSHALVYVAALVWLVVLPVSAQVQAPALPSGPLTLEQVLELAEARSESIALAQAGVRRADGEQTRARSGRYPQLSAAASYDRSLASEFEGVFDQDLFGSGSGDTMSTEESGFEDLPFGRENTWRISLSLSQNLYSGGRLGAQDAVAAAGHRSAELGVTTSRAQLLFDVTQAYYDAALSDRLVEIAEGSLEQAGATLKQTQAGFDAGTQPEFEVLRARVARDSQTPLVIRQRVNRDIALMRLKQLLDLPQDYNLRLADALADGQLAPPPAFAPRVAAIEAAMRTVDALVSRNGLGRSSVTSPLSVADAALPIRTAVTEAAATVRLREASLELTEAQRKPSVALNSTYSRIAYPSTFFPAFDRTNWSIGASLNLPILTGGRQRGDEQVARAELEQSQVQLRQVEELAALDTRVAWTELLAARAVWEATGGTVQQASRAYDIADVRYRAGVSTQLELSDARLLLQQAEANRAQTARDLQVARARVALLPDLPIGDPGVRPRVPQPQPQAPQPQRQDPSGADIRNASVQGGSTQMGTR